MTTYYIDPDAGSSGDGLSEISPLLDDDGLAISNGDSVRYRGGTTMVRSYAPADWDGLDNLTISSYGTGHALIDMNARAGEAFVSLDGDGNIIEAIDVTNWEYIPGGVGGGLELNASTNAKVRNCELYGGIGPAVGANDGQLPASVGTELTGNELTGCFIHDNAGDGFTQQGNTSWFISGNHFQNLTEPGAFITVDGVAAHASGGVNFVVTNNIFENITKKSGVQVQDGNAYIARNVFLGCKGAAILVRRDYITVSTYNTANDPDVDLPVLMSARGTNQIIEDNLIFMPSDTLATGGGVLVWDGGSATIRHNTIVNAATTASVAAIACFDAATISRNLVHTTGAGCHVAIGGRVTTTAAAYSSDDNLFSNDTLTASGGRFAIWTSDDPTPGGADPVPSSYLQFATYKAAIAGLAEGSSIISATTFEGGSTFASRDDFRPLTGSAISGKTINYGARINAWVRRSRPMSELGPIY